LTFRKRRESRTAEGIEKSSMIITDVSVVCLYAKITKDNIGDIVVNDRGRELVPY